MAVLERERERERERADRLERERERERIERERAAPGGGRTRVGRRPRAANHEWRHTNASIHLASSSVCRVELTGGRGEPARAWREGAPLLTPKNLGVVLFIRVLSRPDPPQRTVAAAFSLSPNPHIPVTATPAAGSLAHKLPLRPLRLLTYCISKTARMERWSEGQAADGNLSVPIVSPSGIESRPTGAGKPPP